MKLQELLEGKVKDLWMKLNLNPDGSPKKPEEKKPEVQYPRNVLSIAKKANLDPSIVMKHYEFAKKKFDSKLANYWALVIGHVKKAVHLKEELVLEGFSKYMQNEHGRLQYRWNTDLEQEEEEGYIPGGYSKKVLELCLIEVDEPGKGYGDQLMKMFLDTPEARNAELIFLDPNPGIGMNADSKMSEENQIKKLVRFYKRFGFDHNPASNTKRMWLVQKGHISRNKLPT
jgi:hypothetical protein